MDRGLAQESTMSERAARGDSNYLDNSGECLHACALPSFYRPLTLDLITKGSHLVYSVNNITNPKQIKLLGIFKGLTKQNIISRALLENP